MTFQLIIIGGGTAAIAAISEALDRGLERIAYIERRTQIGGECALNGCVPLHSMFVAAHAIHTLQKSQEYGLQPETIQLNFNALMNRVAQIVTEDLSDPFTDNPSVRRYIGHASFKDEHTIRIRQNHSEEEITGEQILLTCGAQAIIPNITGLADCGYWLYPQATHAPYLPASITIIGGGRIGIEFAQLFHMLGSKVTVIESQDRLLPREDTDLSQGALQILQQELIDVYLSSEVVHAECVQIAPEDNNILKRITLVTKDKQFLIIDSDEILIATGREANLSELGLENTSIAFDKNQLLVDANCRTSVDHIWAAGDVIGPYRFTHAADYQAVVAVQNMLRYRNRTVNYTNLPIVYFLGPALARVGLTESQAKENYQNAIVLKKEIRDITRFRIEDETFGFCKIIIDAETDEILGAHIMAPHAEEMIHMLALAMQAHIPVTQMTQMVYAYPTRSQLIQKTLEPYVIRKSDQSSSLMSHPSKHAQ